MKRSDHELEAVERIDGHLVDDTSDFFAPAATDMIDSLLAQHDAAKARIEALAATMADPQNLATVGYFLEGNARDRRTGVPSVAGLFEAEGALNSLTAGSWAKALSLTDVFDVMPQKRRDEWTAQMRAWQEPGYKRGRNPECDLPPFEEQTVRSTLEGLLAMRATFFAERVDGLFRALSGDHVTNVPEGFSRRMIVNYVLDDRRVNHNRAGFINDLRAVISKFMGRDEPAHYTTYRDMDRLVQAGRFGEWIKLDAGALRLRVYMKGTAHLEVSPEIAYRLNMVLAQLHPTAIPASFRQKPAKRQKEFALMGRPLPFAVLNILAEGAIRAGGAAGAACTFSFAYSSRSDKHARLEAMKVLVSLGGTEGQSEVVHFDYKLAPVLSLVLETGLVPDEKSHQFYPSPASVGRVAVDMAQITAEDTILEPSAGVGDLADLLPKERTHCVEISQLRCAVLEAKGYAVIQADFLAWAAREAGAGRRFTKVVLNPPFADGRALAHLQAAASLVAPGGRVSAVLPASMRGKELLPGWVGEWSPVLSNEFAGTSVSVAIYAASRADRT